MAKKKEITIRSSAAEYLTFVASTGDSQDSVEMRYEDENIWLTQKMMATLYDVDVQTINHHIKKIFEDSELTEESVIRKFRIAACDGKQYNTMHYSLQMMIAVGFKVNNERAVQFRKWANTIVKDYTIKGWVMDDERLKNGGSIRRLPISMPQPWTTTRRRRQPRGFCEGAAQNVLCRPRPHRRRRPRHPDRRREHHRRDCESACGDRV